MYVLLFWFGCVSYFQLRRWMNVFLVIESGDFLLKWAKSLPDKHSSFWRFSFFNLTKRKESTVVKELCCPLSETHACSFTTAAKICCTSAAGLCLLDCFPSQNDKIYFPSLCLEQAPVALPHVSAAEQNPNKNVWSRTIWIVLQRSTQPKHVESQQFTTGYNAIGEQIFVLGHQNLFAGGRAGLSYLIFKI